MAKIAILGFGTVGSGVYEVLCRNAAGVSRRAGEPVEVKYILDPKDFSAHPAANLFIKNFDTILEDPEIRVVVEPIGGTRFAYPYVKACLESGRSVCTSNKEMVATYGAELLALAKAHNCAFLFEASVGGGTPIITPMHQCLAANVITEVEGIVNGTTNFMLTKLDVYKRQGLVCTIFRGGIFLPTLSNRPLAERYTRVLSLRGMRVPSAAEMSSLSLSSKVTVLYRVTARPSASKPEPTLALVAGTETLIFIVRPLFSCFLGQLFQHQLHAAAHGLHLAGCLGHGLCIGLLHQIGAAVKVLIHHTALTVDGFHHGGSNARCTHIICGGGRVGEHPLHRLRRLPEQAVVDLGAVLEGIHHIGHHGTGGGLSLIHI